VIVTIVRPNHVPSIILGATVLLSCDRLLDESTSPPTFPESSSIGSLEIHDRAGGTHVVEDRAIIDHFVSTLHGVSGSWAFFWHTYPTAETRVVLKGQTSNLVCVVDLSSSWIGSDCGKTGKSWPALTSVSSATSNALGIAITKTPARSLQP
jgi:hypothetical protein